MKKIERDRNTLMQSYGYTCIRQSSHMVWRNDAGVMVTTSKTPSDINSLRQVERQLRRLAAA
jgi:hypothetical protein